MAAAAPRLLRRVFAKSLPWVAYYGLSLAVVVLAFCFASQALNERSHLWSGGHPGLLGRFLNWDGVWYATIASEGYRASSNTLPTVVFFPAYPLSAAAFARATGVSIQMALLVITHISMLCACGLLSRYVERKYERGESTIANLSVASFAVYPTTLFFHVTYTEALFMVLCLVSMRGIAVGWKPYNVALVIGMATATRSVGVALTVPLAIYLWRGRKGVKHLIREFALHIPLANWGLLSYMAYLHVTFGDPVAFATAMPDWLSRPSLTGFARLQALLTASSVWEPYFPASPAYWRSNDVVANPLFSMQFANPLFFMLAAGLVVFGAARRWIDCYDGSFAIALLAIPYALQSYPSMMQSHARYAAVAFPIYIVLGRMLSQLPQPAATAILSISACALAMYAAMFSAWYKIV